MIDIASHLTAVHREVALRTTDSGDMVSAVLRRHYDAPALDVWGAITEPDRIRRWFLPLTGDLRAGGSFQLEGNAGGSILHCEEPHRLSVTFGGPTSTVDVRLTETDGTTTLELTHTVPIEIARSGAGALFVGPGWDGALMALALFTAGEVIDDPVAAGNSLEAQEFSRQSVAAWACVIEESGTAEQSEIAAMTEMSLAQFAPDLSTTT
jgi:uncharacterized protein YndB with AHSA1/START domain